MAGKQITTKIMTDADEDAAASSLLNANREAAQPRPGTQQQQQAEPEVEYVIVEPTDEGAGEEGDGEREESLVEEQDEADTGRRSEGRLEDRIAREKEEARKKGVSRSTLRRQKARETWIAKDAETDRLRNDLERMRAQVEELQGFRTSTEPRLSEFDVARKRDFISGLDGQIADAQSAMERHEAAFSQALADGDSAGAAKALRAQQEAFVKRERLATQKTIAEQQTARTTDTTEQTQQRQAGQQRQQRPPDPVADDLGRQFLRENPWINVKGGDEDSDLVRFLDEQVARAGYKPNTQAYWDELRKRAERHMPHRFEEDEDEDDGEETRPRRQANGQARTAKGNGNGDGRQERAGNGQQQRRGPMTAGSGEGAGQVRKQKVVLSAARKEQLQLAGAIDHSGKVIDPARFESYMKSYVKFDRENAAA